MSKAILDAQAKHVRQPRAADACIARPLQLGRHLCIITRAMEKLSQTLTAADRHVFTEASR